METLATGQDGADWHHPPWSRPRRALIRKEYLKNAATFHHTVAENKEPWVQERTPDDAGR